MRVWCLLGLAVGLVAAGGDDGPGDPDFSANDGDLDSAVNPQVNLSFRVDYSALQSPPKSEI